MNLSYNGTINNQWETLCEKVYKTSVDTLGHTTRKHQDWFDENYAKMLSLLEERRRTHDAFLSQQTRNRKLRYTQAKSKLQKKLEQCLSVDQLLILSKLAMDYSKDVSWQLPCSLSFWQHYCLQCPST